MGTRTADVQGPLWGARAADWASLQEGQLRPLYERVLEVTAVTSGTRYLDAGCGAGGAAHIASEKGATVAGFDASEELLGIARTRVPSGDFRRADLEEPGFDDASFDVITGINSFQYAGDPAEALRQARRMLAPGGILAIAVWGEPGDCDAARGHVQVLGKFMPPPPPGAPGPFALSNEEALRGLAESAGLSPKTVEDVACPWTYPDLQTAVRALLSAGVAVRAINNSSQEEVEKAQADALGEFRQPDGGYLLKNRFRFLLARA